ncbi:activator-dependent family glycosyltransferase [Micromonospora sp. NPDC049559]|uniref:activator-dependent family glycosyltransferase n=1 Tax=Micromonospora sp. NPDC049559 TaxID=3155923 RepID=UPI00342AB13D
MRVLFATLPHSTHWYPLVPLAWALRTAGHEVRVASEPELVDVITGTGLTAVPVGRRNWADDDPAGRALLDAIHDEAFAHLCAFDFAGRDPAQWTWERLLCLEHVTVPGHSAVLGNDSVLDELVAFARAWRPDLVVWETYTVAGAVAATVVGAAHARMIAGPDVTMRVRREFLRQTGKRPVEHRFDPTAEWLGWTLERLGCAEPFTEELVTGQWTIDSTPASTRLDADRSTVPMRYVPFNGPSVLPHWLRTPAARPRICLTFGVSEWVAQWLTDERLADLLGALAELDVEVVVTGVADRAERLRTGAPNVRLVGFVPLNDLLPTCAAVVHHGGVGTKATAELHGVPQVILSFGADTTLMGEQVERLGAGLWQPIADVTPASLRQRVARVVGEESFAAGARRLRDELLAAPSPNEVVPVLEKLTAERRGRPR